MNSLDTIKMNNKNFLFDDDLDGGYLRPYSPQDVRKTYLESPTFEREEEDMYRYVHSRLSYNIQKSNDIMDSLELNNNLTNIRNNQNFTKQTKSKPTNTHLKPTANHNNNILYTNNNNQTNNIRNNEFDNHISNSTSTLNDNSVSSFNNINNENNIKQYQKAERNLDKALIYQNSIDSSKNNYFENHTTFPQQQEIQQYQQQQQQQGFKIHNPYNNSNIVNSSNISNKPFLLAQQASQIKQPQVQQQALRLPQQTAVSQYTAQQPIQPPQPQYQFYPIQPAQYEQPQFISQPQAQQMAYPYYIPQPQPQPPTAQYMDMYPSGNFYTEPYNINQPYPYFNYPIQQQPQHQSHHMPPPQPQPRQFSNAQLSQSQQSNISLDIKQLNSPLSVANGDINDDYDEDLPIFNKNFINKTNLMSDDELKRQEVWQKLQKANKVVKKPASTAQKPPLDTKIKTKTPVKMTHQQNTNNNNNNNSELNYLEKNIDAIKHKENLVHRYPMKSYEKLHNKQKVLSDKFRSQSDQTRMAPSHLDPISANGIKPKSSSFKGQQKSKQENLKQKFQTIDVDIDRSVASDENKFIKKITIPIDSALIKENHANSDRINLDINLRLLDFISNGSNTNGTQNKYTGSNDNQYLDNSLDRFDHHNSKNHYNSKHFNNSNDQRDQQSEQLDNYIKKFETKITRSLPGSSESFSNNTIANQNNSFHGSTHQLPPISTKYHQNRIVNYENNDHHVGENEGYLAQMLQKQAKHYPVKPYTLKDYRKFMKDALVASKNSGHLGFDYENEEYRDKLEKAHKKFEYAQKIKDRNHKIIGENLKENSEKELVNHAYQHNHVNDNSTRQRALEYAKATRSKSVDRTIELESNNNNNNNSDRDEIIKKSKSRKSPPQRQQQQQSSSRMESNESKMEKKRFETANVARKQPISVDVEDKNRRLNNESMREKTRIQTSVQSQKIVNAHSTKRQPVVFDSKPLITKQQTDNIDELAKRHQDEKNKVHALLNNSNAREANNDSVVKSRKQSQQQIKQQLSVKAKDADEVNNDDKFDQLLNRHKTEKRVASQIENFVEYDDQDNNNNHNDDETDVKQLDSVMDQNHDNYMNDNDSDNDNDRTTVE